MRAIAEQILAVIDIGSNSTHLLVARSAGQTLVPLADESVALPLGADVARTGAISDDNIRAAVAALRRLCAVALEQGAGAPRLLATEAIRAAANGAAVVAALEAGAAQPVRVLAAAEEARLDLAAATVDAPATPTLAIDVGGGSTQVVVGVDGRVAAFVSLPVGSGRPLPGYPVSDPPRSREVDALAAYFHRVMAAHLPLQAPDDAPPQRAVALGGMARRLPGLLGYPAGAPLPTLALAEALNMLQQAPAAQLADRYGMAPARAVGLLPGVLILRTILEAHGLLQFQVSPYSIREAAVLRIAQGRPF